MAARHRPAPQLPPPPGLSPAPAGPAAPRSPRAGSSRGRAEARFWYGAVSLTVTLVVAWLAAAALLPAAAGWRPVAIVSGSMEPSIRAGDIVVARSRPAGSIEAGEVVVFDDPTGEGLVTHRVVEVLPDGAYLTRGDANRSVDPQPVRHGDVVGAGRILVPLGGLPAVWFRQGRYLTLLLWLAALLAAVWGCRYGLLARYNPWGPGTAGRRQQPAAGGRRRPADATVKRRPGDWCPPGPGRRRRPGVAMLTVVLLAALTAGALTSWPGAAAGAFTGATAAAGGWGTVALLPPGTAGTSTGCSGGDPWVQVEWTVAPAPVEGYELHRSVEGEGWQHLASLPGSTTTTHTDGDVETGSSYSYRVTSTAAGWTSQAATQTAAAQPPACPAP